MKKLFFLILSFAVLDTLTVNWFWKKKAQPAAATAAKPASDPMKQKSMDAIGRDINKLINENQQLKQEISRLSGDRAEALLKKIDQNVDYQKVTDTIKNIGSEDTQSSESIEEIAELQKQIEHLGMSLYNTLKTFESNINSATFSNVLKENEAKLDTKEGVKAVNEAIANALYRLKFMYTEIIYMNEWMYKKINWTLARQRGINPPVFNKDLSHDEIKKMVMAVKVD